jgi:bifunctional UDP-N-acetylglucosamine pyrophosphorylase/glucosamine-1-phosphate N-acetyltransferase
MTSQIQVVILAAGQGKRMYSHLPKVLHKVAGKTLIEHVLETAIHISPQVAPKIVYGHQGNELKNTLKQMNISWVEQKEQLGTGHAVLQALSEVDDKAKILVLYGDVPFISVATLQHLIKTTPAEKSLGMLTIELANPTGYGRIKRERNQIVGIVEEKDATDDERTISEVNPGIYLVNAALLKKWLPALKNKNAQGEYYLTDIIALAVKEGLSIHAVQPEKMEEVMGVNDRLQLAHLERFYQREQADNFLKQGVTLRDPARFDVRGEVEIGKDVSIDINVILEGRVIIGDGCVIGANCIIKDAILDKRVEVKANSMIDGASIAADCVIGPFARIRPGTVLLTKAHIGNFVEIKKSDIGEGTKINHLSYVGDSEIGAGVNIGAGTITCNYDGVNKHKTVIGNAAFIGSGTQLVAPVQVGEGATIGAGSTITKDAPANQLTLTRTEQRSIKDWRRPVTKG